MIKRKTSAYISLVVCIISAVMLAALIFTMPTFFRWIYLSICERGDAADFVIKRVVTAFYACVPFAAAALFMMIKVLLNIIKEKIFITQNVYCFRFLSWCCYGVMLITLGSGIKYIPLLVIAFAMGVVGTLLRVIKNIMQSAVEIKAENELTI